MTNCKHILIIFMALALVSCGKDDPYSEWEKLLGDKPLRFSSAVLPTKAESPLVQGSNFGVFAFLQEGVIGSGTPATWTVDRSPNFMFNQLVTRTGNDPLNPYSDYTYSPLCYWPSNEENTVSFWAYSPYNASAVLYEAGTNNTYTRNSHGLPDMKFSVTDGKADFMTSALVQNKTYENCDPNPNDNNDLRGIVNFEFGHRLAWVEFKAKTKEDYSPMTFTVTRIEIINAYNDAVYHQNTNTWTDGAIVTGQNRQIVAFSGSQAINSAETSCSSYPVLMIPQDMVHDASATGTVKARISFTQSEGGQNVSKTVEASLEVTNIDEWLPNHKYTYTFTITASDAINISVEVQKWEYWLGTSDYKQNVTITKQLTWDPDTYVAGGSNCTRTESFTVAGVTQSYKVLVLKPGVNLMGSFIFDTPYNGKWYAMLEPIQGSTDGSIRFTNDSVMLEGTVGNESEISIKANSENVSSTQYAVLRFMCRTQPVDPAHPESAQTLPVQDALMGGPFIIQQNIN